MEVPRALPWVNEKSPEGGQAKIAMGLAVLELLRWGGFKGMTYRLPVFIEGTIHISGTPVDLQRIIVIGIGIVVVSFMWLFTHFNRTGLALRGMAQDEHAAMMLGIDSDWMAVIAMAMGSILAGLSAIVLLPLGNIVVEAGYNVLILSIAVCIVGGLGSWVGAILAAFRSTPSFPSAAIKLDTVEELVKVIASILVEDRISRARETDVVIVAAVRTAIGRLGGSLKDVRAHKLAAHLAGLGWIGKSCLLLTEQFGPRVRFVSVLTDAPLEAGSPLDKPCGKCQVCIDACP
jgi:hypothetical protein